MCTIGYTLTSIALKQKDVFNNKDELFQHFMEEVQAIFQILSTILICHTWGYLLENLVKWYSLDKFE